MSVKYYNAPWGRKIWWITGAVSFIGASGAIVPPLVLPVSNTPERWALWSAPVIMIAIVGGTALWMVRGFELTNETLIVRRVLWTNQIPLSTIESAEVNADACKGAWKTMGNDGLFAMHGRFRSKQLGRFQAYVTNPANSVVLKVPDDTIVISPGNPRGFVKELNRRLDRLKEKR